MKNGDRVTREVYMDDGTWARLGDKCLPQSPLRHGTVSGRAGKWVKVKWDDGTKGVYLPHGLCGEPQLRPI